MNSTFPTPDGLTLPQIMKRFSTEETAIEYLESIRWSDGVVCPHCKNADQSKFWKIAGNKEKKIRAGLRQCVECKKQFRVTVGTIFEDSHIPLNLWLVAWYLICGAKKGMSAKQLQRHLGLGSYKSAWFMAHRIRHAMQDPMFSEPMKGTVEVDETYVGGKEKRSFDPVTLKMKTGFSNKTPVVSLVERNGKKRSFVMRVTAKNVRQVINEHIDTSATVMTDESRLYPKVCDTHKHKSVNHRAKEYARKEGGDVIHTNTVESSFSLLKRGIIGSFHHVSRKHLHRYMAEFDFRWNHRKTTDGFRTVAGLRKIEGKRLLMKEPKA